MSLALPPFALIALSAAADFERCFGSQNWTSMTCALRNLAQHMSDVLSELSFVQSGLRTGELRPSRSLVLR